MTDAWTKTFGHLLNSALEANKASLAALGGSIGKEVPEAPASVTYSISSWNSDSTIQTPGEVSVGDVVTFTKSLSEEAVQRFALASGDTNRLHLDEQFAQDSRFDGTIVHGMLVSGLISAALARLPGLTIYLSQDISFCAPVEVDDSATARCEVVEDLGDRTYRVTTCVFTQDGQKAIDGEAVVLINNLPDDD